MSGRLYFDQKHVSVSTSTLHFGWVVFNRNLPVLCKPSWHPLRAPPAPAPRPPTPNKQAKWWGHCTEPPLWGLCTQSGAHRAAPGCHRHPLTRPWSAPDPPPTPHKTILLPCGPFNLNTFCKTYPALCLCIFTLPEWHHIINLTLLSILH